MLQAIIKRLKKDEKGFTLIELVVVIAIIGILAVVLIPKFGGFTEDAKVKAALSQLKQFKTVAETIYAQNGSYPPNMNAFNSYIPDAANKKDPWNGGYTFLITDGYTITDSKGHKVSALTEPQ